MGYLLRQIIDSRRPIINIISSSGRVLTCLVDTGANMPVFTLGENEMVRCYPDAIKIEDAVALLAGFGNGITEASVYEIPSVIISADEGQDIVFKKLVMACVKRRSFGCNMIFSHQMFSKVDMCFLNKYGANKLRLEFEKHEFFIRPCWNLDIELKDKFGGKDVLETVYSFTQSQSDTSTISDRVSQMEEEMKQALANIDKEFEC